MSLTTLAKAIWPKGKGPTWLPLPDGDGFAGPYGSVRVLVVTNPDGSARHDKPINTEAPCAVVVPWTDTERGTKLCLISEVRSTARRPGDTHDPVFLGFPGGFIDEGETPMKAARRELGEETGVVDVRTIEQIGEINPNPTSFNSSTHVFSAQVSLESIRPIVPIGGEKILKVEFFFIHEIMRMIARGEHEGALLTNGVSLSALVLFFAKYPSKVHEASLL